MERNLEQTTPETWLPKIHSTEGHTFTTLPTHEQIARRAQEIYIRNGCRDGESEQNWLQAERELLTESVKMTAAEEEDSIAKLPQSRRLAPNFRMPRLRLTRSSPW